MSPRPLLQAFFIFLCFLCTAVASAGHWKIIFQMSGETHLTGGYYSSLGGPANTHQQWPSTLEGGTPTSQTLNYIPLVGGYCQPPYNTTMPDLVGTSAGTITPSLEWIPGPNNDPVPTMVQIDITSGGYGSVANHNTGTGWTFEGNTSCDAYHTGIPLQRSITTYGRAASSNNTQTLYIYPDGRTSITLNTYRMGGSFRIGGVTGSANWGGWVSAGLGVTVTSNYAPGKVTNVWSEPVVETVSILTSTLPPATAGVDYETKIEAKARGKVTVRWDPVAGATLYRIRRTPTGPGFPATVNVSQGQQLAYLDYASGGGTDLSQKYEYTVTAESPIGAGPRSDAHVVDANVKPDELLWIVQRSQTAGAWDLFPEGMTLKGQGVFSARPYYDGTFQIIVDVFASPTLRATKTFTLTVAPAPALTVGTTSLPTGYAGESYQTQLQANGGVAPYRWSVLESELPHGLTLSDDGVLSGTATELWYASDSFTVKVEDAAGTTQTQTFTNPIEPVRINFTDPTYYRAFFEPWWFVNVNDYPLDSGSSANVQAPLMFVYTPESDLFDPIRPDRKVTATVKIPLFKEFNGQQINLFTRAFDDIRNGGGGLFPSSRFGDAAWFTQYGSPYDGVKGNVPRFKVQAELIVPGDRLFFLSSRDPAWKTLRKSRLMSLGYSAANIYDLEAIRADNLTFAELKEIYRQQLVKEGRQLSQINAWLQKFQDGQHIVGEKEGAIQAAIYQWCQIKSNGHSTNFGEIVFHGSDLSKGLETGGVGDGNILICGDKSRMSIKGGLKGLLSGMAKSTGLLRQAAPNELRAFRENVKSLATEAEAAKVKNVFVVTAKGSKMLKIVRGVSIGLKPLGLISDGYDIYVAKDKLRSVVKAVAGWAGAAKGARMGATATALAMSWLELGPGPGTVAHGIVIFLGGLGGSIAGYYAASGAVTYFYDRIVQLVSPTQSIGYYLPRTSR